MAGKFSALPSEQLKNAIDQLQWPQGGVGRVVDGVVTPYLGVRPVSTGGPVLRNHLEPLVTRVDPRELSKIFPSKKREWRGGYNPAMTAEAVDLQPDWSGVPSNVKSRYRDKQYVPSYLRMGEESPHVMSPTPAQIAMSNMPQDAMSRMVRRSLSGGNEIFPTMITDAKIGLQPHYQQVLTTRLRNDAQFQSGRKGIVESLRGQHAQIPSTAAARKKIEAQAQGLKSELNQLLTLPAGSGDVAGLENQLQGLRDQWVGAAGYDQRRSAIAQKAHGIKEKIYEAEDTRVARVMPEIKKAAAGDYTMMDFHMPLQQQAQLDNYPLRYQPEKGRSMRLGQALPSLMSEIAVAESKGTGIKEIGSSRLNLSAPDYQDRGLGERAQLISHQSQLIDEAAKQMSAADVFNMQAGRLKPPEFSRGGIQFGTSDDVTGRYPMAPQRIFAQYDPSRPVITERVPLGYQNLATPETLEYNRVNSALNRSQPGLIDQVGAGRGGLAALKSSGAPVPSSSQNKVEQLMSGLIDTEQRLAESQAQQGRIGQIIRDNYNLSTHFPNAANQPWSLDNAVVEKADNALSLAMNNEIKAREAMQGGWVNPVGRLPEIDPVAQRVERLSNIVQSQNIGEQRRALGGDFTPTEVLQQDPRVSALREKAIAIQQKIDESKSEQGIRELMSPPRDVYAENAAAKNAQAAAKAAKDERLRAAAKALLQKKGLSHLAR